MREFIDYIRTKARVDEDFKTNLAASALALGLVTGAGNAQAHQTRGMRDDNPTNVHTLGKHSWKGEIGHDKDGEAKFDSVSDGFRAGVKNFLTHLHRTPNKTVEKYLRGFANTANKNQFHSYILNLQKLGIDTNTTISRIDPVSFVAAQSKAESGMNISQEIQDKVREELGL